MGESTTKSTSAEMFWFSIPLFSVLSVAIAVPVEVDDAETREDGQVVSEENSDWRQSAVLPVLLNPFSVTKLTCGGTFTLYDGADTTTDIEVDICLVSLLVTKLVVAISFLLETQGIYIQSGLFGILDTLGLGLGEESGDTYSRTAAQRTYDEFNLPNHSGWNFGEWGSTHNLPRSMMGMVGSWSKAVGFVTQTLVKLDKAVKITHHQ